ncbi:TPA: hypothetical protein MDZ49_004460 [Klebsiella pneumoniae]|uniref:hypothetical protein n=1 Tax=Klebsiella pneumoniae complex TaxID=3390273 RepID=UPI0007D6EA84|nr:MULTISPECIES: hypothetical protein [Klebsiella]HDU2967603.1 hypothetical protein [Klebsiella pneumoniae subsp. pneumoniae]EKU8492019.1 hypothetical protein [Klebsiella pneumoniae]MCC4961290.1 hypothetical protein [Klebsiella pneumoniae]MDK9413254.1 hypothetical protein [Klebsiella pneumoniae]MDP1291929.1 hypothetical protein [Klebsiella variicola]
MSKIWVKEISHPGGTATFQAKEIPLGAWVDVYIRAGSSAADIDDYNQRVIDWKDQKTKEGFEIIEVPDH